MGFTTLLDIIGSVIIGGILMLTAWRLNNAATESKYNNMGELTIQENLVTIAEIIEHDFRKIGFHPTSLLDPTNSIIQADTSSITFLTDIDSDGNIDELKYYLGSTSELLSTPNPRDRLLYRVINNKIPVETNLGITKFHITYYDVFDDEIPSPVILPGTITSMEITVVVENVAAYDEIYSNAFWRQIRLASRNLRQR